MPPHAQLSAVLIDHPQVHQQVRRHLFQLEVGLLHRQLGALAHRLKQGVHQGPLPEVRELAELRGKVRQRHQTRARLLVQRFAQDQDLVLEHARHQPLAAGLLHLVERVQRNRDRHTVTRVARFMQVAGCTVHTTQPHDLRKRLGGDARGLVPHQLFGGELEHVGVLLTGHPVPALQGGSAAHLLPQVLAVVGLNEGVIHQQVLAPGLVLQRLYRADRPAVVWQEGKALIPLWRDITLNQGFTNEDLPCQRGINLGVADAAVGIDEQAIQRGPLHSHHLTGLALPMRLQQLLLQQVGAHLNNPARLNGRNAPAEQPGGLHQFRHHDPASRLAAEVGPGVTPESNAPRAQVVFLFIRLQAHIAQQAGQQ